MMVLSKGRILLSLGLEDHLILLKNKNGQQKTSWFTGCFSYHKNRCSSCLSVQCNIVLLCSSKPHTNLQSDSPSIGEFPLMSMMITCQQQDQQAATQTHSVLWSISPGHSTSSDHVTIKSSNFFEKIDLIWQMNRDGLVGYKLQALPNEAPIINNWCVETRSTECESY